MIVAVRQVQGHCEYVDRNAKLDDGRAKCGEVHQQFRLKDMMDDKHIGDLRALETIQGLPEHPNTGLCLAFRRLVMEAEASDLLSGSECRVLLFNDMVRHLSAGRDSATSLFGICVERSEFVRAGDRGGQEAGAAVAPALPALQGQARPRPHAADRAPQSRKHATGEC